jgi:hypothetical protein
MMDAYSAQMQADKKDGHKLSYACNVAELNWYHQSRPYYKAYPSIIKSLCSIKLDYSYECPLVPMGSIAIRFAAGFEPSTPSGFKIGAILISQCTVDVREQTTGRLEEQHRALLMMIQSDDIEASEGNNSYAFALKPSSVDSSVTIEQIISRGTVTGHLRGSDEETRMVQSLATRIALTICFLADDPSIVTPEVLSADRERYATETDEEWKRRAEERAKRRGVVGWNIGAEYEVCPHYRRPHFGIRHTGKGRTVPRIVPIKGAVVHRSKLTEVPTGYILPDGTEVESGKVVSENRA